MNQEKLIKKAQKGNKKAFGKLIENEQLKLYKTAFLYTKNKEDALDIVQETVYKALISIQNLKEPKYFSTWLTKILINTSIDLTRKKKKIVSLDFEELEKVPYKVEELELRMDLFYAIDSLNERYKTIIILRFYQDFTLEQIADLMEIPKGTVKSSLHRALQSLKVTVKEDCINE